MAIEFNELGETRNVRRRTGDHLEVKFGELHDDDPTRADETDTPVIRIDYLDEEILLDEDEAVALAGAILDKTNEMYRYFKLSAGFCPDCVREKFNSGDGGPQMHLSNESPDVRRLREMLWTDSGLGGCDD